MPLYSGDMESPIEENRDAEHALSQTIADDRARIMAKQADNEKHMKHRRPHQTISGVDRAVVEGLVQAFDEVMKGVEEAPVGCLEQVMITHAGPDLFFC